MAKKDKFGEMKIKLVMKLRRMSRAAAVAEIARMDAARKKAETKGACGENGVGDIYRSGGHMVGIADADAGMSAEEFFGCE